jgi:hypothetical protein
MQLPVLARTSLLICLALGFGACDRIHIAETRWDLHSALRNRASGQLAAFFQPPATDLPADRQRRPADIRPEGISPLQLEFFNRIHDAYREGNSVEDDGCQDFEGGVQQALAVLEAAIGDPYNTDYGFAGFDLVMSSHLEQVDPPNVPETIQATKESRGIRSGTDVLTLYGEGPPYYGQPWIAASVQSRDCHSVVNGVAVHRVEIFDFSVVAYLLPLLQKSEWVVTIRRTAHDAASPGFVRFESSTQLAGRFQVPELEPGYLIYNVGNVGPPSVAIGTMQGVTSATATEGLQDGKRCSSARLDRHVGFIVLAAIGGAVRNGGATLHLGPDPMTGYGPAITDRDCWYVDTGESTPAYLYNYAAGNWTSSIEVSARFENTRFADTYRLGNDLLPYYEMLGLDPDVDYVPLDLPILESGQFTFKEVEWAPIDVTLERLFREPPPDGRPRPAR